MDLYITNSTVHTVEFSYRLPGGAGVSTEHIPVGAKVKLPGQFTGEDIRSIVAHHRPYGLAPLDRTRPSSGVFYSTNPST